MLRKFREEAVLTVRELSEQSGVSEDTITKIENGHRKGRPITLRKLAQALGIDHRELVETTSRSAGNSSLVVPGVKVTGSSASVEVTGNSARNPSLEVPTFRSEESWYEEENWSEEYAGKLYEEYENKLAKIRSDLTPGAGSIISNTKALAQQLNRVAKNTPTELEAEAILGLIDRAKADEDELLLKRLSAIQGTAEVVLGLIDQAKIDQAKADEDELSLNRLRAITMIAQHILELIDHANDKLQREYWVRKVESGSAEHENFNMAVEVYKALNMITSDGPTVVQIEADIKGATPEQVYRGLNALSGKMQNDTVADVLEEGVYKIFQEALKTQSPQPYESW